MPEEFTLSDFEDKQDEFKLEDFEEPTSARPEVTREEYVRGAVENYLQGQLSGKPQEEQQRLVTEAYDLANRSADFFIDQSVRQREQERLRELAPSRTGVIAREAAASAIPAAASAVGFTAGAALGAPLAPFTFGTAPLITGAGVGLLAGAAATDVQEAIAEAMAPEATRQFKESLEAGRERFPISAAAGRLAGAAPTFQVALPRTIAELGKRAAVGGAFAGVPAVVQGRAPTPEEIAEGIAFAGIYGDPRARALRVTLPPRQPSTIGEPNAIQRETTKVLRPVRGEEPVPSETQVPVETRSQEVAPRGEPVQPQETAASEIPLTPEATTSAPIGPLRPALLVEGNPVIGKIGDTHEGIQNQIKQIGNDDQMIAAIEAFMDDANHVFVDPEGNVLNRAEAGKRFDEIMGNETGTTPRLHSQNLIELPNLPRDPIQPQEGTPGEVSLSSSNADILKRLRIEREKIVKDLETQEALNAISPAEALELGAKELAGQVAWEPIRPISDRLTAVNTAIAEYERAGNKPVYLPEHITEQIELNLLEAKPSNALAEVNRRIEDPTQHKGEWTSENAFDFGYQFATPERVPELEAWHAKTVEHARARSKEKGQDRVLWNRVKNFADEALQVAKRDPERPKVQEYLAKRAAEGGETDVAKTVQTQEETQEALRISPETAAVGEAPPPLPPQFQGKSVTESAPLVDQLGNADLIGYTGKNGSGATGFMWDLGSTARTTEDVSALRTIAESTSAKSKELMKEGKFDEAMALVGRQPAEAYEFATGVKLDGTPKWQTFEQRVPGYRPSVPDAKYLEAKQSGNTIVESKPDLATSPAGDPSPQALGIVAPGTVELVQSLNKLIPKPKGTPDPIKTDVTTPLPDFQEHATSKSIFSQPFGFERIPVLGAAFSGVRRLTGHVNESLATYWAEREVGRAVSSAFGNEYRWIDKPFIVERGQIINIKSREEGASLYISDVFEALKKDPASYTLNAEQRKAFDTIQKLETDFGRLEQKYGIGREIDNEASDPTAGLIDADIKPSKQPYFPRIVVSRPGGVTQGLPRGQTVGSKAFFEKPRMFDTEAEGWAKGYTYEPSIVNRLATRTERLYKRIADKRLANDKALGGLNRKELEAQLKETYAEELASGAFTEERIKQIADSLETRGRVFQPAFFNKIFPEETARALNKAFPNTQSGLRQFAASVNNAIKGLKLGFDLGVGFIQGQALAFRHPAIWAKAQANGLRALVSPAVLPDYVRNNLDAVRELAQMGSSVGQLEEYMAGLGQRGLVQRVPEAIARRIERTGAPGARIAAGVARLPARTAAAFGRQFSTFLDVAKVEMWKGIRETTPREQWFDAVQSLESVLQSGRMESVGVGANRASAERALLLAPAYYRGGLNLIAAMAERGIAGQVARRAMGAYALGGATLFYGIGKLLGMTDEDLEKRFNPARSDFMMWRIKNKNRTTEVGFGGFYRSLMRLAGNATKTSIENPKSWKSLAPDKNPITRWYRAHAGPVVGIAWDMFTGKDFMGEDTDIASLPRAVTPLPLERLRARPDRPTPTPLGAVASFIGLSEFAPGEQKNTRDIKLVARNWLASNPDPKLREEFKREQELGFKSEYAALRNALGENDLKAAGKAYTELLKTKKPKDILEAIRPYSLGRNFERRYRPITGSSSTERAFVQSLTTSERQQYQSSRAEQDEIYRRFRQLLQSR